MEPEPVAEPTPAPASERPVRAAAQKAAQKKAEEAEAAAKKKAASGKATAAALQKKLAAQKEAASGAEAAQKARIEELEAELGCEAACRVQVLVPQLATHGGVVDEGDRRLGPEGQNDGSGEVHRDGRRHLRRPGVRGHVWMLPALRSFASVAESVGAFGAAA